MLFGVDRKCGGFCSLPLAGCNLGSSLLTGRPLHFIKNTCYCVSSKNTQNITPGTGVSVRNWCVWINLTGGASWPWFFYFHLLLLCSSSDVCLFKAVSTWGCFCKSGEKILVANVLCWPWICVHRRQAWSALDVTIWTCNSGSMCCWWNRSPFLVTFVSSNTQCSLLCLVSYPSPGKALPVAAFYSAGVS